MRLDEEPLEESLEGLRTKSPEALDAEDTEEEAETQAREPVRQADIPTLSRDNGRLGKWLWFWTMALLVGVWWAVIKSIGDAFINPQVLLECLEFWLFGVGVTGAWLLLFEPRSLRIDRDGVRLKYWWREVVLPWDEIQSVTEDQLTTTTGRKVKLSTGFQERNVLVRLIRGIVAREPLKLPEELSTPDEDFLLRQLGGEETDQAITLKCRLWLWSSTLQGCAGCLWWLGFFPLVALVLRLLGNGLLPWTTLRDTLGWPVLIAFFWTLGKRRYPSRILIDPEGVKLYYLFRRRGYSWQEILGASSERLLTLSGPVALLPDDEASQKLVALVRALRESRQSAVRLPPDDAERSLTMVSPEEVGPSGRELAEPSGRQGEGSGRELEERPPG